MSTTYETMDDVIVENQARMSGVDIGAANEQTPSPAKESAPPAEETQEHQQDEQSSESKPEDESSQDGEIDYGLNHDEENNEKVFTKKEFNEALNKKIRERFERMERNRQQFQPQESPKQQYQEQNQYNQQQADPENVNWEEQLYGLIDKRVEATARRTQEQAERARQQQEEFEYAQRLSMAREKYSDFDEVVERAPISKSMLDAMRGHPQPGDVFYAAALKAPKELERIAQLRDPFQQAAEMGRLELKLRQTRKTTEAPKPLTRQTSDTDLSYKDKPKSLDDLIAEDSARKLKEMRMVREY